MKHKENEIYSRYCSRKIVDFIIIKRFYYEN